MPGMEDFLISLSFLIFFFYNPEVILRIIVKPVANFRNILGAQKAFLEGAKQL
jgi:hypothetical protein